MKPTQNGRARNEQKEISNITGAAGYSQCQKQYAQTYPLWETNKFTFLRKPVCLEFLSIVTKIF
jgi:hypothetical protein